MSDIIPYENPETSDVLASTIQELTAGLTGLAASDRKELVLSAGRIFQSFRTVGFLGALKAEWEILRERGRIAPNYTKSEQHHACLQELLSFLDEEVPDGIRFNAMKNLFLNAALEDFSDSQSILPHQYMQVCR